MAWVSQMGVLGHSYHLKGHQPTLPKPMEPHLVENRLHKLLGVCKILVIPFVFTGFKGHFEVGYLISLGQVETIRLC